MGSITEKTPEQASPLSVPILLMDRLSPLGKNTRMGLPNASW
jgi:hypothetical protein